MDFLAPGHVIVIAVVAVVVLFGSKRLPEMSRSVGRSLRIFKAEIKGLEDDALVGAHAPAAAPVVAAVPGPSPSAAE